ncbi:hypothetical protein PIB30_104533, partial [Stylosanthes scabra]|nr:hypothetical protein [Stylosanthes scabra]
NRLKPMSSNNDRNSRHGQLEEQLEKDRNSRHTHNSRNCTREGHTLAELRPCRIVHVGAVRNQDPQPAVHWCASQLTNSSSAKKK